MTNHLQQLLAVSVLVGCCEELAASGLLREDHERELRWSIAKTLTAFNMPTRSERQDNTSEQAFDAKLGLVREEMGERV